MYFEPEHSQSNAKFRLIFAYARMSRQVRPWVSIKGVTGFARITRDFRRRTGFFFSRGETKKAKGGARRYESPAVDSRGVGALGTQNLIKLPGRHISRACVARETAGTLWKSNAYISHFGAAAGSRRAGGTGEGGRRGGRHFVFTHSSIIENWRALSLLSRHSHRFFSLPSIFAFLSYIQGGLFCCPTLSGNGAMSLCHLYTVIVPNSYFHIRKT